MTQRKTTEKERPNRMNAIDRILNEVDVDYKAYATIPTDLLNEYPFLAHKTCHDFSLHIALTMVLYSLLKYVRSTSVKDEGMLQLIGNVAMFSARRFHGGRELLGELQQYQADYFAYVKRNGGHLSIPRHLESSGADVIIRSCEKVCFPYIECLAASTFDAGYSGSSANFFRHFIRRAESRYLIYKPLFDEYVEALRNVKEKREKPATPPSTSPRTTGCLIPLLIGFSTMILSAVAMVKL